MRAVFVPSSVRKPFGSIDRWIKQAIEQAGTATRVVVPGERFPQRLEESVRLFHPDFLLTTLGCRLDTDALHAMAALDIPSAIWYTDDPYAVDQSLTTCRFFNYVFTVESACVPVYRKAGCNQVFHLPLAAPDPFFFRKKPEDAYRSDVLILGSAFRNRLEEVDRLASILASCRTKIVGQGWERLRSYKKLSGTFRSEWVSPQEAAHYYRGAQVVLNIHRSPDDPYLDQNRDGVQAETPNNRTFEIAACRSFQLASYREGLSSLYPGGEVVSYRTERELRKLLAASLLSPAKRYQKAILAYRRTCKQHRYLHRIQRILDCMASDLPSV
ncbi:CgeB family protein [Salinithrix halophila]|uniref:Glycosyltransferase n=1 Tax=Salinithrix halophila TaxID=1485204 RepID=A0ABV8JJ28_9BACL